MSARRQIKPPRRDATSSNLRDQVVKAFEADDRAAIRQLGWEPVWEARATWWRPKQTCTAREMVPLAKLLGGEDPGRVPKAHEALAGPWQPTPAEVRGHLNRQRADDSTVNVGRGRDRAATPEALKATAAAVKGGARVCECGAPTLGKWDPRPDGVLRCASRPNPDADARLTRVPGCGGLEIGQVRAAEDAGYTTAPPGHLEATGSVRTIEGGGGAHVA
jgi:hypothetical protein